MTKKKQKKGKGGRAKAPKLPKQIAGVKVPKELREPGGKLLAAVRHPLVLDIAAAALIAAAAGLRNEGAKARAATPDSGSPKPKAGADIGAILAATALEGVRRLTEGAADRDRPAGQAGKGERAER